MINLIQTKHKETSAMTRFSCTVFYRESDSQNEDACNYAFRKL